MKAIEKRRQLAGQGGFTLIELLIVIAILGILAAVVVFAVGNVTGNATEKACKIEYRSLRTAVQAYKGGTNVYPTNWSQVTGTGNEAFLEDVPDSNTWNQPGSGGTVTPVTNGKCDGQLG